MGEKLFSVNLSESSSRASQPSERLQSARVHSWDSSIQQAGWVISYISGRQRHAQCESGRAESCLQAPWSWAVATQEVEGKGDRSRGDTYIPQSSALLMLRIWGPLCWFFSLSLRAHLKWCSVCHLGDEMPSERINSIYNWNNFSTSPGGSTLGQN